MSEWVKSVVCNGDCDNCSCVNIDSFHRIHGCLLDGMKEAIPEMKIEEFRKIFKESEVIGK